MEVKLQRVELKETDKYSATNKACIFELLKSWGVEECERAERCQEGFQILKISK